MDQITAWFDRHELHLPTVLATVALLVAAPVVIAMLNRMLRHLLTKAETRLRLPYETVLLTIRILTGASWFVVALLLLNIWGISVSGLWTVLVSAATLIGVGFLAVWTMISNVTANLFITLWRPFQFGQTVEVLPENYKGRVIDRNMMFTVLREESGCVLQIPNNLFFQKPFRVSRGGEQYFLETLEHKDGTQHTRTESRVVS